MLLRAFKYFLGVVVGLAMIIVFQNCSEGISDPSVSSFNKGIAFDENAKLSDEGVLSSETESYAIYEYKIRGEFTRPCKEEDDYLDSFRHRCGNFTGFRLLNNGTLIGN